MRRPAGCRERFGAARVGYEPAEEGGCLGPVVGLGKRPPGRRRLSGFGRGAAARRAEAVAPSRSFHRRTGRDDPNAEM